MWVMEPYLVSENSGSHAPDGDSFWAAELGCEEDAFWTDWSGYGVIDVFNDAIVPGAVFDIQLIDCRCHPDGYPWDESGALTVAMSVTGDIVGLCDVSPCSAPQGVVDFIDITAAIDKFRNLPTAPRKARTDVINGTVSLPKPDQKVDFVDISQIVDAFRNDPVRYPGPPTTDPCSGS
jgi:hypothetical protein